MKKAEENKVPKKQKQAKIINLAPSKEDCPLTGLLKDLEKIDQDLNAHWQMESKKETGLPDTLPNPDNDTDLSSTV